MTYPNEQLPAGRPLKRAPAYSAMTEAGCQWGQSWDLEVPLYFGGKGFEETPSLKRSNAHDVVGAECRAVRDGVGLLDISGFSRYEVSGPNAEAWLNGLFSTTLPKPGRARLAVALGHDGRLKGDLTLFNWGDGTWWIMGSYYLRTWHMRWFNDHMQDGVLTVRDLGEDIAGFSLSGPKSRAVIEKLIRRPGWRAALHGLRRVRHRPDALQGRADVGCRRTGLRDPLPDGRSHLASRGMLLEAGAEEGIMEYGFNALLSLRLEKSFGIWSAEFTQGYTAGSTGMDRWINWDKGDFIGKAAAMAERDGNGPAQKVVTLEVASTDADASGFEPVWKDGNLVGFVTSGGYGHTVGKSLAMAMVNADLTEPGTDLSVHIVGAECAARVIPASPYDPEGKAMRA